MGTLRDQDFGFAIGQAYGSYTGPIFLQPSRGVCLPIVLSRHLVLLKLIVVISLYLSFPFPPPTLSLLSVVGLYLLLLN